MENQKFKVLSIKERNDKFMRILRARTDDLLSNQQLNQIIHVTNGAQCTVVVAQNENEFRNRIVLSTKKRWIGDHDECHTENGTKIFGSFEFGYTMDSIRKDGKKIKGRMLSTFDEHTPAAAFIKIHNFGCKVDVMDRENLLLIYIPYDIRSEEPDVRRVV